MVAQVSNRIRPVSGRWSLRSNVALYKGRLAFLEPAGEASRVVTADLKHGLLRVLEPEQGKFLYVAALSYVRRQR
jgi:hypothetical protein